MINSVKMGLPLQTTKLLSFTASSDFTSVLPYVSLTSTNHLYLPVHEKTLVVKCEHQESFNEDLDDSGKFRKQLGVDLLCWEHEACLDCAAPQGSVCLFVASSCFPLP